MLDFSRFQVFFLKTENLTSPPPKKNYFYQLWLMKVTFRRCGFAVGVGKGGGERT